MLTSSQMRSSDGRRSSGSQDISHVQYPSAYDVTTYIRDLRTYCDTTWLTKLRTDDTALVVPDLPVACDKDVGSCIKC